MVLTNSYFNLCLCFLKRTANYSAGDGTSMDRYIVDEILSYLNYLAILLLCIDLFLHWLSAAWPGRFDRQKHTVSSLY